MTVEPSQTEKHVKFGMVINNKTWYLQQ